MGLPDMPVAASTEEIAVLKKKLSTMRHNVNNHLALVVAAAELMRRKPELTARLLENMLQQPEKINAEIRAYSEAFDEAMGIKRSQNPPPSLASTH